MNVFQNTPIKVVFFGTPSFAVPCLDRLLAEPAFEVLGVVTQPDKRRGRGSAVNFSPVKERALAAQLPLWQPERIKKDEDTLAQLQSLGADFFAVVAYGQILSPDLLAMPHYACINVHGSLLPAYRGAAPIQWSLRHGHWSTGITTMRMDAGMDTGDMLQKATTPISLWDNFYTLGERLSQQGAELLVQTLKAWPHITPEPQDPAAATYAPLLTKADYGLHWSQPALTLHHQIRGFYPQCHTTLEGTLLKILGSVPLGMPLPEPWQQERESLALPPLDPVIQDTPGTIVAILKNQGPVIQTGSGYLLLTQVQPAGKRVLSGWDFVNGSRLVVGNYLGF
jgi:methionyl-tRNA formyltransferase